MTCLNFCLHFICIFLFFFPFWLAALQRFIERNADPDEARVYITFTATFTNHTSKYEETMSRSTGPSKSLLDDRWIRTNVQRQSEHGLWPVPVLEQFLSLSQFNLKTRISYQIHNLNTDLTALFLEIANEEESVHKSNKGGYQSQPDLFERTAPELLMLRDIIYDSVASYISKSPADLGGLKSDNDMPNGAVEVEIYNAWFGLNKPGDSNSPHIHPAASISGVYYVACPEVAVQKRKADADKNSAPTSSQVGQFEKGRLHLLDPRGFGWTSVDNYTSMSELSLENQVKTAARRLEQVITPEPGKLVMFPGFVEHWVEPYREAPLTNVIKKNKAEKKSLRISVAFNARVKQLPEADLKTRGVQIYTPFRHARQKIRNDELHSGADDRSNCDAANRICM